MRLVLTFLLVLTTLFAALAQADAEYSDKYRKWKVQYSENSILQLKDGALLVRLKTRAEAIKLYRESGQDYVADRMDQNQFEENREIVKAFLNNFNFCKVYFFFKEDTEKLDSGETSGYFLDDRLKRDSSIVLSQDFYMIAEYGPVEAESYVIPGDTSATAQYVNSAAIERGLVVKDANYWQMAEPFPYYVRGTIEKYIGKQVSNLNAKLHNYYQRVNQ